MTDIFQASERIERPVGDVWGVLTDWGRAPQWMKGVESMHAEGASAQGTTVVFAARGQERTSTIEAWTPPRRLVLTSRQGGMTARYEYRCEPEGGATRVTLHATCEARGPVWRLLTPLIRAAIRRSDAGQVAALKRVVESS